MDIQLCCFSLVFNCLQAIQTIDGEIAQQLSLRRKRDGVGATFFDTSIYTQGSMGVVPEALRPKPGHLSLSQQRVYEVMRYFLVLIWSGDEMNVKQFDLFLHSFII